MTIDERIKLEEKAIKDMQFKEEALDGLPGYMVTKEDYEECRKSANEHQQLVEWLKELQAHRESWEKAKRTVKAYLMLEEFGVEYQDDIEKLIDGCIPKEGDVDEGNSN